jgi:hypothetical protein
MENNNYKKALEGAIEISLDNLNQEKMEPGAGGKSKSKSQRRLFALGLRYKNGTLDPKIYKNKPDFEKKLKNLAKLDDKKLHEFTNTFQKKRKKSGEISKHNAIPDRVPISAKEKERLKNKKIKEKNKTLAEIKAKKTAEAAKKMKIGMSKGPYTKSEIKKRLENSPSLTKRKIELKPSRKLLN